MKRSLPSKELLDRILKYDPETGAFRWRVRPLTMFTDGTTTKLPRSAEHACAQWNSRWAGKPAAPVKSDGYCYVHFNYRNELAHRVAWKIMTGEDPIEIDHIDGNRSNNKWTNLRNGTRSDNLHNMAIKSNNTSGYHGVSFSKRHQRWLAAIHVGSFDSKEEAIEARKKAEALLGYHPNHGRKMVEPQKPDRPFRIPGVTWETGRKQWFAQFTRNGKTLFLGRFDNFDDAVTARKEAEAEYHGDNADDIPGHA